MAATRLFFGVLFHYFAFGKLAVVAASIDRPEHVHISLGNNDSMVVMWSTRHVTGGIVQYGVTPENMTFAVPSSIASLPQEYVKANPYIHRAELKHLRPGTTCFYRVVSFSYGDPDLRQDGDMFSFTTYDNQNQGPDKFIVYGDMGADDVIPTYGLLEELILSRDYKAILHVGDLGYDLHSDYGKVGDDFLRKIQPFSARVPYMTAPGNHEIGSDFQHYGTRFSMPGTPWPMPKDKLWYSFDIGLVHFISYSTEVFFTDNEDLVCTQFDWLLQDLIEANRNREERPWIIAMGHRPMYCSNNNGDDCTNRFTHRWVKYGLEDLFHAQGVDLVIQAHEHSYERLWPVYNEQVYSFDYNSPKAPVHIITGAAGSVEGVDWMSSLTGISNEWSAFRADTKSRFTIGILEVHNKSHIYFDQRDTNDNNILDSFWLIQNNHGPFVHNITCSGNGSDVHISCFCPPPIRYIVYIVLASVIAFVVIVLIVAVVCYCRRRRRALVAEYQRVSVPRSAKPQLRIRIDDEVSRECFEDDDDEKLL